MAKLNLIEKLAFGGIALGILGNSFSVGYDRGLREGEKYLKAHEIEISQDIQNQRNYVTYAEGGCIALIAGSAIALILSPYRDRKRKGEQ